MGSFFSLILNVFTCQLTCCRDKKTKEDTGLEARAAEHPKTPLAQSAIAKNEQPAGASAKTPAGASAKTPAGAGFAKDHVLVDTGHLARQDESTTADELVVTTPPPPQPTFPPGSGKAAPPPPPPFTSPGSAFPPGSGKAAPMAAKATAPAKGAWAARKKPATH